MKKILIVVDMQKDFVDGTLGSAEAVTIVPFVCEKIKNFDGEIIVTYDTHGDDYLNTSEGRQLPIVHCVKNSDGWRLNKDVQTALFGKKYTEIEKPSFGSCDLPGLVSTVSEGQEFEIELVGLCTDICVVSNALILKAHFPEIKITVDSKCCAGVTIDSHNAALNTMKMCQIDVF